MRAVILDSIAKGDALVLVDGLDEITNLQVRMMFCQELERTAVALPGSTHRGDLAYRWLPRHALSHGNGF